MVIWASNSSVKETEVIRLPQVRCQCELHAVPSQSWLHTKTWYVFMNMNMFSCVYKYVCGWDFCNYVCINVCVCICVFVIGVCIYMMCGTVYVSVYVCVCVYLCMGCMSAWYVVKCVFTCVYICRCV